MVHPIRGIEDGQQARSKGRRNENRLAQTATAYSTRAALLNMAASAASISIRFTKTPTQKLCNSAKRQFDGIGAVPYTQMV
jgi:hypothetical protein